MRKLSGLTILILCSFWLSCNSQKQPVSLHPENPHYFLFRGEPAVLITSGEHYGAVINLDFDYIAYLNALHSKGLNCTRTFAGPYVEFAGWYRYSADQPLSPASGRFICPWARSDESGYINGGNKFDLSKWDEAYFKRLKDFISQASQRGVVVELTLFCPYYNITAVAPGDPDLLWKYSPFHPGNNINDVGNIPRVKALTLDNGSLLAIQEAYVRKVVSELKDYDNIIYELCNEPYIQNLVPHDWMVHMTNIITEAESNFKYRHLLSHNYANGVAKIKNPVPGASVFNFHYSNPRAITLNYGMNKVIGNNETDGFEPDDVARLQAWEFIIGGGGLFNNLDMSFTTTDASGKARAELRSQLSFLKKFIEGFDFVGMKPDSAVIKGGISEGLSANALSEPGVAYVIYLRKRDLRDVSPVENDLIVELPPGKYQVVWTNTETGKPDEETIQEHQGGEMELKSPLFNLDVALDIRRINQ
ncbi:MAG: cellulase family glycosylhydrolase [Bacteroidales bacterium]|nr:cellulase family glycosylhydrolase [Bacteroidales bacterium]